jgi:Domain of unknown function (DUF5103)
MRKDNLFLMFLVLMLCRSHVSAQSTDYADGGLQYRDMTYVESVKSVLLYESAYILSDPIIELNSNQQLNLEFDELGVDYKRYRYTFVHCDSKWKPSDILVTEYLNGYPDDIIFNYQFSTGTSVSYVHYELKFPTQNMRPAISGNYLLIVFDEDKEHPIITRRFFVLENLAAVSGLAHQATFPQNSGTHQEVDFSVVSTKYNMTNPYNDLNVVILQNQNWNNAIYDLKPQFANNGILDFNYNEENNILAGNEFRLLDLKSFAVSNFKIARLYRDEANQICVDVLRDEFRTTKPYIYDQDLQGKFTIKTQDRANSNVQAEYVKVNFSLIAPQEIEGGNLYLMGAFTNWDMQASNRMKYDKYKGIYTCDLLLKQGFYNYQYAFVKDGKTTCSFDEIEGNHYQTENMYSIYIYHRTQGKYYERLVGYKQLSSLVR